MSARMASNTRNHFQTDRLRALGALPDAADDSATSLGDELSAAEAARSARLFCDRARLGLDIDEIGMGLKK
jgi:hypothetical protein